MDENQQRQQLKYEMEKMKGQCERSEFSVELKNLLLLFVTGKDKDTPMNSQVCKRKNK